MGRLHPPFFPGPSLLVIALALSLACGQTTPAESASPSIRLIAAGVSSPAAIELSGLPSRAVTVFARGAQSPEDWQKLLRVTVATDDASATLPPVAGSYIVRGSAVVFTPMFGLDPGVQYSAAFDPTALPSDVRWKDAAPLVVAVGLPRGDTTPSTFVNAFYPSGDEVPENLLRMYLHFSSPMGRQGGISFVHLRDDKGREVKAPFLPLEAELWNGDRTRFTVFLDPGRVKRGILPNEEMGRALAVGGRYTLVVDREWTDGRGLPLKDSFTKTFRVGAADTRPLDPATWRLTAPPPGSREPLTVRFPEALDHGLMLRALGVRLKGGVVNGEQRVADGETSWSFIPAAPWTPGDYQLIALTFLEDPAGNRIGRAFEVDEFERTDPARRGEPESVSVPFTVR